MTDVPWDTHDDNDEEPPLVAPYMATGGRISATQYNPTATVSLVPVDAAGQPALRPAHLRLLEIVQGNPRAIAEIAAVLDLPVNAVRVLLTELVDLRLVAVASPEARRPSRRVLQFALDGLRALP